MFVDRNCDLLVGHGIYISLIPIKQYNVRIKLHSLNYLHQISQEVSNARMHQLWAKDNAMKAGTAIANPTGVTMTPDFKEVNLEPEAQSDEETKRESLEEMTAKIEDKVLDMLDDEERERERRNLFKHEIKIIDQGPANKKMKEAEKLTNSIVDKLDKALMCFALDLKKTEEEKKAKGRKSLNQS